MILIADAGSTKTDWVRAQDGGGEFFSTPGINPTHMSPGDMVELLREGLSNRWTGDAFAERIVFYGAGCGNPRGLQRLEDALRAVFPYAEIEIYTDILGAARALWGHEAGMACILGTGANAGYYDGESVFTHPSLGYLLGDEASGASLGKGFLKMYLRGRLPLPLTESFEEETGLTYGLIMENLYMQPFPARFMASLAPFVLRNRGIPEIDSLINAELDAFFNHSIMPLGRKHNCYNISFTGSVACALEQEIRSIASTNDLQIHKFICSPIQALLDYHLGLM